MNSAAKTLLPIALAAVAMIVLLAGNGVIPEYLLGTGAPAGAGRGGASSGEFGVYLTILILVDVALGAIVAWMFFGSRE